MKLILMFLIIGSLQLSANVYSQNGKMNVQVSEMKLADLLWELQESSDLVFVYRTDDVQGIDNISLDLENASITDILDKVLSDTHLEYKLDKNVVVIKKKEAEPKVIESKQEKQEKKIIKGTVTDENGETLPGVSVVVKGTTYGVSTDIDGNYKLLIPEMGGVLVFSFVGMESQEVQVKSQKTIDVILKSNLSKLNEVVVTGYQTLSRERATGSFEVLKSEDIERITTVDLTDNLEGKISGLVISETGEIQIRGISTMSSNKKPLIVIDGFPTKQSLSSLNPKDVASITVLKDAAAASIWGVRASNGVIVITTKIGSGKKDGKVRVDFSASTTMGMDPELDALDWVDAKGMVELQVEAYELFNIYPSTSGHRNFSAVDKLIYLKRKNEITDTEYQAGLEKLKASDNKKQIGKYLFRNSIINQYNLALSSSTEKTNTYLSASFADTKSQSVGNDNQRVTLNFKNDYKFNDRVKAFFKIYTKFSKKNKNSFADGYLQGKVMPYDLLLDENGEYLHQGVTYNNITPYDREKYEARGYRSWRYNLLEEQRNADKTDKSITSRIQTGLNMRLLDGVTFDSKLQYEYGNNRTRNHYSEDTFKSRHLYNFYTEYDDETESLTFNWPEGAILDLTTTNFYSYSFRNQLNINKSIGEKGKLVVIAGAEIHKYFSRNNKERKIGFNDRTGKGVLLNFEDFQDKSVGQFYKSANARYSPNSDHPNSNGYNEEKDISMYGNAGYTYDEKFNLTASFRIDQSNLFGTDPKYRYNPLWSIGSSYNISKEDYFKVDWVDHLKIRGTYGFGGNVDRNTSKYLKAKFTTSKYPRETVLKINFNNPPNPKLRPERTAIFNLGVDFGVLNNRISGTFEYFSKKSEQLLTSFDTDYTVGYGVARFNAGSMTNSGYDFNLSARIIDNEFKWDMDITLGRIKNEVTQTREYSTSYTQYLGSTPMKGYPMNSLFAFDYLRVNEKGDAVIKLADGRELAASETANIWPTHEDLIYMGTRIPKISGGGSTEFLYKGFRLALDFTYKFGHKMRMPAPNVYAYNAGRAGNASDIAKRWREPGDELNTMIPRLARIENGANIGRYNDIFFKNGSVNVDDASYVRLRHVTLRYKFPKRLIEKYNIDRLEFKLQVSNVGYWAANKKGYDPDYVRGNQFMLPKSRKVNLGFNIQF